jgi:hypothetical protein
MIHLVDKILRLGLLAMVPGLTTQQIGFQPPDNDWRSRVGTIQGVSLNVYLAEIAEDRGLRTNARHLEIQDGVAFSSGAPERIRLHYAISAWSHVKDALQVTATETEHALLGVVLAGLYRTAPINATRLLPYADVIALPGELQGDLPTQIAPPDGFPRLAEFWGTMGRPQAWKPVINLMVTAPITLAESSTRSCSATASVRIQPCPPPSRSACSSSVASCWTAVRLTTSCQSRWHMPWLSCGGQPASRSTASPPPRMASSSSTPWRPAPTSSALPRMASPPLRLSP